MRSHNFLYGLWPKHNWLYYFPWLCYHNCEQLLLLTWNLLLWRNSLVLNWIVYRQNGFDWYWNEKYLCLFLIFYSFSEIKKKIASSTLIFFVSLTQPLFWNIWKCNCNCCSSVFVWFLVNRFLKLDYRNPKSRKKLEIWVLSVLFGCLHPFIASYTSQVGTIPLNHTSVILNYDLC